MLIKYASLGDATMVKQILPYNGNEPLRQAFTHGWLNVVNILLDDRRVNPGAWESISLLKACENGHTEIVKRLLESGKVNPHAEGDYAMRIALQKGYTKIVKLLGS